KRLLIHTIGFTLGLLMRRLIGVGTRRGLQGRVHALVGVLPTLTRARATGHWLSSRLVSTQERVSIARYERILVDARAQSSRVFTSVSAASVRQQRVHHRRAEAWPDSDRLRA